ERIRRGSFTGLPRKLPTQTTYRSDLRDCLMHATPMPRREVEVKLELPPTSLPQLRKIPFLRKLKLRSRRANEISVYFDTDKHKLRKKGLMLRVRRVADRHVQTIKATGDSWPLERDEWEAEIAGEEPDLSLANGTALESLLTDKLRRQL